MGFICYGFGLSGVLMLTKFVDTVVYCDIFAELYGY